MNSDKNIPFKRKKIYYEKQGSDRLCGVHCLNALLQGPFYDAVSLSEIGLELDRRENLIFKSKNSFGNVSEDGNFNVQVIEEALKQKGCGMKLLKKREYLTILEHNANCIEAFIFNSASHWYSVRKIEGIWFNLNSLSRTKIGPEIISEFYLSAFLEGAEEIGYSIFLINNLPPLPDLNSDIYSNLYEGQKLVDYNDIVNYKDNRNEKPKDNNFNGFSGKGVSLYENNYNVNFEDDDMQQAYENSILDFIMKTAKELPKEPIHGITISIKYNNQCFKRKWNLNDNISELIKFAQISIPTTNSLYLIKPYPKKILIETQSLAQAGLCDNDVVYAQIVC